VAWVLGQARVLSKHTPGQAGMLLDGVTAVARAPQHSKVPHEQAAVEGGGRIYDLASRPNTSTPAGSPGLSEVIFASCAGLDAG